jgi:hypothetical protein
VSGTNVDVGDLETVLVEVLASVFAEEALPAWDEDPAVPPMMVSRVGIAGASGDPWGVEVRVGLVMARLLAGRMFAAAAPSQDDLLDAIGELGNIVGGNVKSLLPVHSRLSLPSSWITTAPLPADEPSAVKAGAVMHGQLVEVVVRPGESLDGLQWPPGQQDDVLEATP